MKNDASPVRLDGFKHEQYAGEQRRQTVKNYCITLLCVLSKAGTAVDPACPRLLLHYCSRSEIKHMVVVPHEESVSPICSVTFDSPG